MDKENKSHLSDEEQERLDEQEYFKRVESIVKLLDERAKKCHWHAYLYLWGIILTILVSILIFVFAYKFTETESVLGILNSASSLKFDVEAVQTTIDDLAPKVRELIRSLENGSDSASLKALVEYAHKTDTSYNFIANNYYKISDSQQELLAQVRVFDQTVSNYQFITSILSRVGILLILFFVVQILLRIYRYNERLGNYYMARMDALKIYVDNESLPLDQLIAALSPDGLDIGTPKSPTDQLMNLVNRIQQPPKKGEN